MKKLFIGVVIFAVISVLVTGVLINIKNKNLNEDNSISSGDKTTDLIINVEEEPEKTIDLYGTYNENDLIVEGAKETFRHTNQDVEVEIPKIRGLKNKTVEDKVNNDIKNRISEVINKLPDNSKVRYASYTITGNFSNVLSGYCDINYEDDKNNNESIAINYELINGERLKLEDLFVKDMDFNTLIRKMVYKEMERNALGREAVSAVYYDKKTQKWLREYYDYEEDKEKIIEDEPYITENDLNKMMKEFINDKEKNFYFSPTKLNVDLDLDYDDYSINPYYYFKDIANEVTIYDKYLTKESIYESQNIGAKNLWTCSPALGGVYGELSNEGCNEYGFANENLYYEISKYMDLWYNDKVGEYTDLKTKMRDLSKQFVEEKIEEYRKVAVNNPNKFYVIYLGLNWAEKSQNDDKKNISLEIVERVITSTVNEKQMIMDALIGTYRYPNIRMYSSGVDCTFGSDWYRPALPKEYSSERKDYTLIYNLDMIILPDSSTRKLEKSEIQDLTNDELNKAYNEIFARHGHEFKNKELREYFDLCPWYEPIANKSVSLEELSEVERYNIDIIRSVINDKKVG